MGMDGARWVMMAHDIQSRTWERYFRSEKNPIRRWYIGQQCRKYRRYEQNVFSQAPLTIAVTREDAEQAGNEFFARRTAVVDNGVDVEHYLSAEPENVAFRRHGDVLFLGNLEWRPNLDAVRTLLDHVFPRVIAEEPSARLCIVGRHPPEWLVERCKAVQSVELHADVPDVRPYLYRCGALAVPLRIGSGSRLKILEALAARLPVVSTKVGAEGLFLKPGVHFAEAETPEAMADILLQWMRNPDSTRDMTAAGRRLVKEQYDWSMLAQKMETAWDELIRSTSKNHSNRTLETSFA
jgi:glycosyltransferase involved in cell wall biosynthesis